MGVVVALGVGLERRAAVARRVADHLLVAGPQHPRGLERLVVEPRRHELRKTPAEALQIERERGPSCRSAGNEALVELDLRRLEIGDGERAGLDLHERVRLLRAGADDAARPAVLEAARQHPDPMRQQRRGERIAGVAAEALPIERKGERAAPIDARRGEVYAVAAHGAPFLRVIGLAPFGERPSALNGVGRSVAPHDEELPAAGGVLPHLPMPPLGVLAHEEIVAPCLVANRLGLLGPRDKGFSAVGELLLLALLAAVRAIENEHRKALLVSERRPRRHARR